MKNKIDVTKMNNLLPMPMSATRMAILVADINSTVDEFKHVIELDQALTAHVLRWVNSAWANPVERVVNVKDAVVRLGTANILKLAMGQNFLASMNIVHKANNMAENDLWYHGIAAALAAEHLSKVISQPVPPIAFTAALMHDVGKMLLGRQVGYDMMESALLKDIELNEISFIEAEHRLLGTDHTIVGAEFAKYWKFPEVLIEAIATHHQKVEHDNPIINIVILADAIAKLVHPGINSQIEDMDKLQGIIKKMGLDIECIYTMVINVKEDMEKAIAPWHHDEVAAR